MTQYQKIIEQGQDPIFEIKKQTHEGPLLYPEAGAIPSCINVGRFNLQGVITESMLLVCSATGT